MRLKAFKSEVGRPYHLVLGVETFIMGATILLQLFWLNPRRDIESTVAVCGQTDKYVCFKWIPAFFPLHQTGPKVKKRHAPWV